VTPEIRNSAAKAISNIENRQFFINQIANLFYGLSLGSILLLAALGLAITFGLMGVINMAHGEMLMLGAYSTFLVQNLFKEYLPGFFEWYLLAAIPIAFMVSAMIGVLLERSIIRHLYGRPLETLLATWGISLILIQSVRLIFGAQNVAVANPSYL
jgi:urea transport system permease protein